MKKVIIAIMIGMLAAGLCSCVFPKQEPKKDVYSLLHIKSEDIVRIELGYKDYFYPMIKGTEQNLIRDLSVSSLTNISDSHEYTPSDYTIRFVLKNDQSVDTCFCFFSGLTSVENPDSTSAQIVYTDTRYDIRIGDKIFHFRFSPDHYWTEDDCRAAFDMAAKAIKAPTRVEIDGFDQQKLPSQKTIPDNLTWQEVIDSAELVVLARFQTKISDISSTEEDNPVSRFLLPEGDLYAPRQLDLFTITEVLKGDWTSKTICIPANVTGKMDVDGYGHQYTISLLPDVRDPEYKEEQTYLLCLAYRNEDIGYFYPLYARVASTAILDDGYLYPRQNTEQHPFSNVLLEEVKDYCRK